MNWKLLLPARCEMLSVLPVMRLSMAMTRCPSARSRSDRCEPRKPAPPVTTDTGAEEVDVMYLSDSQNSCRRAIKKSEGLGSFRPETGHDDGNGAGEDFEVEPEGPVVDVLEVELHPLIETDSV